ncbi:peptidoglycan DD-metalloendopeptidase family protein [Phormidesmis priestleyi]
MTQDKHKKFPAIAPKLVRQRFFLLCGMGWWMGLGVLSGRVTLAQTPTIAPDNSAATPDPVISAPEPAVIIPAPAAPEYSAPEIITPKAAAPDADTFIDRTNYNLGATQREQPVTIVNRPTVERSAPMSVAPIQAGPVSLSSSGIGWNPGSTTPVGREYSTVRDYYNRTVRPIGRLSNNIRLIFPLAIPAPITSLFGWRVHPITGDSRFHSGTDLGAPMGTPVLAAYAGQVAMADFLGGYGLAIALSHNQNSQQTLYAHLSEIFVKPGEVVKQGTVIGRVGSTGNSTGPHLHFEFRQLTTQGWVAMDAGTQLETAMADLVKAMQVAQAPNKSAQAIVKPAAN